MCFPFRNYNEKDINCTSSFQDELYFAMLRTYVSLQDRDLDLILNIMHLNNWILYVRGYNGVLGNDRGNQLTKEATGLDIDLPVSVSC